MAEEVNPRREEVARYLDALKAKRTELLTGAQSYSIGNRSLARYNIALKELNVEIRRVERELDELDGRKRYRMKRCVFHDKL